MRISFSPLIYLKMSYTFISCVLTFFWYPSCPPVLSYHYNHRSKNSMGHRGDLSFTQATQLPQTPYPHHSYPLAYPTIRSSTLNLIHLPTSVLPYNLHSFFTTQKHNLDSNIYITPLIIIIIIYHHHPITSPHLPPLVPLTTFSSSSNRHLTNVYLDRKPDTYSPKSSRPSTISTTTGSLTVISRTRISSSTRISRSS